MNDLISRQAAIDAIERLVLPQTNGETMAEEINRVAWRCAINCAEEMIGHLPSAERHGRWTIEAVHQYELAYGTTAYEPVYKCSCCGLVTESYLRFDEPIMPDDADFPKWCGNCGARMDGEEK